MFIRFGFLSCTLFPLHAQDYLYRSTLSHFGQAKSITRLHFGISENAAIYRDYAGRQLSRDKIILGQKCRAYLFVSLTISSNPNSLRQKAIDVTLQCQREVPFPAKFAITKADAV